MNEKNSDHHPMVQGQLTPLSEKEKYILNLFDEGKIDEAYNEFWKYVKRTDSITTQFIFPIMILLLIISEKYTDIKNLIEYLTRTEKWENHTDWLSLIFHAVMGEEVEISPLSEKLSNLGYSNKEIAIVLMLCEAYDYAIQYSETFASDQPDDIENLQILLFSLMRSEELTKWHKVAYNILELDPENVSGLLALARIEIQGLNFRNAIKHLESARNYDPYECEIYYLSSVCHYFIENYSGALSFGKKALNLLYGDQLFHTKRRGNNFERILFVSQVNTNRIEEAMETCKLYSEEEHEHLSKMQALDDDIIDLSDITKENLHLHQRSAEYSVVREIFGDRIADEYHTFKDEELLGESSREPSEILRDALIEYPIQFPLESKNEQIPFAENSEPKIQSSFTISTIELVPKYHSGKKHQNQVIITYTNKTRTDKTLANEKFYFLYLLCVERLAPGHKRWISLKEKVKGKHIKNMEKSLGQKLPRRYSWIENESQKSNIVSKINYEIGEIIVLEEHEIDFQTKESYYTLDAGFTDKNDLILHKLK